MQEHIELRNIGVFTSGGDAPGMNACIRAVVRTAHHYGLEVTGILEGYRGMVEGKFRPLSAPDVSNTIARGGTLLRSSRCPEFREASGRKRAFDQLKEAGIQGLIAIGGNGTFMGAQVFEEEFGIPTIGVPGTIDNDLSGTDFTIGFSTACQVAVEAIDKLRDTATSHNRLFFVEVMGRDSGYIAVHTCVAAGAEAVLYPEDTNDLEQLMRFLQEKSKRKVFSSIVVVAEGDETGGAVEINKLVRERYPQYDTRVTVLGHLQRGGSPTVFDRLLASRLGMHAVEALRQGKRNVMVGQVRDEVVLTPFGEALAQRKRLNIDLLRMSHILVA
ncbi:MAG: 6-phosphofructokinase [Leptolyngbya sp. SIO3F4]|nr:6-phosphofructokinase [Leptolyngbya sp. SIO3F4]